MTIENVSLQTLENFASRVDCALDNLIEKSTRKAQRWQFRLVPTSCDSKYARSSWQGRRIKAASYEAFRDFIGLCLIEGGKVSTAFGKWSDIKSFSAQLFELRDKNIGSLMYPVTMGELSNDSPSPLWVKP